MTRSGFTTTLPTHQQQGAPDLGNAVVTKSDRIRWRARDGVSNQSQQRQQGKETDGQDGSNEKETGALAWRPGHE
ncbi:hypothetical protein KBY77_00475 [Synechococcus sp. Cruz-7E5]|nr:hypothetical protein [Synechococcus sp. Edmonson 11F2]MCP9861601.1 hypothetical protein [Synechococcus sp. Cruz-7E5]